MSARGKPFWVIECMVGLRSQLQPRIISGGSRILSLMMWNKVVMGKLSVSLDTEKVHSMSLYDIMLYSLKGFVSME